MSRPADWHPCWSRAVSAGAADPPWLAGVRKREVGWTRPGEWQELGQRSLASQHSVSLVGRLASRVVTGHNAPPPRAELESTRMELQLWLLLLRCRHARTAGVRQNQGRDPQPAWVRAQVSGRCPLSCLALCSKALWRSLPLPSTAGSGLSLLTSHLGSAGGVGLDRSPRQP